MNSYLCDRASFTGRSCSFVQCRYVIMNNIFFSPFPSLTCVLFLSIASQFPFMAPLFDLVLLNFLLAIHHIIPFLLLLYLLPPILSLCNFLLVTHLAFPFYCLIHKYPSYAMILSFPSFNLSVIPLYCSPFFSFLLFLSHNPTIRRYHGRHCST